VWILAIRINVAFFVTIVDEDMASLANINIEIEAALIEEIQKLREALILSTNGLRHCSRWNISEEKAKAIMCLVLSNEALLNKKTIDPSR
jgi:hypothetical protein